MSERVGRIPEDTIQTIRDRIDIVDLVGRYVSLKKAGRSFKGLCPFHQEKTPSFVVTPERGTFHCFGCGEGGNVFAFLMKHENLSFPEAVRSLASELGVMVPETGGSEPGISAAIYRANQVAQTLYQAALLTAEGKRARAYLQERGIGQEQAVRYGLGFAPDRWDGVVVALRREGIAAEIGEKAGLLKARERGGHFDMLRSRVTFPIQDVRGRVVGFGGRALAADQEPKYLNTPESPVFRKRESFYGFPAALAPIRQADRAVVVEGYFDWIALHRAGVEEALATCGTALTPEHARNLQRRTRHVVLLFDGDAAGQRAILRSLAILLPEGLRVRAAMLPGGQDPDDFLRTQGAEALAREIDAAPPALQLAIDHAVASGTGTPWERADAVAALVPLLVCLPDPVERGEWSRRLALAVGTQAADVEAAVRKARTGGDPHAALPEGAPRHVGPENRWYGEALGHLIDHPEIAAEAPRAALLAQAPDEDWRRLAEALFAAALAGNLDPAALLDHLEGAARTRLSALAAGERPTLERPADALRVLRDTQRKLARQERRREALALNARIARSEDDLSFIQEKQRQLEQKQAAIESTSQTP